MNEKMVISADGYDRIDGRNAYHSPIKRLSLGAPTAEQNKCMEIAAQLWRKDEAGGLVLDTELPIHQVLDLAILLSRTLLYFKEAYRMPLLHDPDNPGVERVGIQGGVLPITVCTENPNINQDIQAFSQALSNLGELTGERLRTLARILEELECY